MEVTAGISIPDDELIFTYALGWAGRTERQQGRLQGDAALERHHQPVAASGRRANASASSKPIASRARAS